MKKSILTTIEDCTKALRVGVADNMVRWCLISEGWPAAKANQIMSWAKQRALHPEQPKQIIDTVGETVN